VADLITTAGPNRLLFLDLHADQIQGFFNIPVDNLLPDTLFLEYMRSKKLDSSNAVIVSPDVGTRERVWHWHVKADHTYDGMARDGKKY